ncbi:hypothetical protein J8273_7993 [Carpediemonas membranifera]|uniref:Uncharacterized protein n=1 Tax=Carpediemonas membranifera TaxID=201153 RepID=A0A8J6AQ67_9EUKA|nr:hypothetical protein J8273_7993 [Carpediemonas membranifera]|eukprot:KAG9390628.1 hypothetical protein J8273_7993 [Carpediemonas membranifera]
MDRKQELREMVERALQAAAPRNPDNQQNPDEIALNVEDSVEEQPHAQYNFDDDHHDAADEIFDPFEALVNLPNRFGLRDEAKWLYAMERDLIAGRLSSIPALIVKIYGRQQLLLLKDSWDDATAERCSNLLNSSPPRTRAAVDILVAKAKIKGIKKRDNFRERGGRRVRHN